MFELNFDNVKKYASLRKEDAYVMPMYISLYNEKYSLDELETIKNYSPNSIKVGFVSVLSMKDNKSFCLNSIYEVNNVQTYSEYDNDNNTDIKYIVFDTGYIDGNNEMYNQINYYVKIFDEYIKNIVLQYRNKLREELSEYFN